MLVLWFRRAGAALVVGSALHAPAAETADEARLRAAIDDDAPDVVRGLLDRGASIATPGRWDPTLLDLVVEADAADVLAMLITRGEAGEAVREAGWLMYAAGFGSARVARLLVERGAQVDARGGAGWTSLHGALRRLYDGVDRAPDTALMLIEAGADVNAQTDAIGFTPLHLAADINAPEVARALIAGGARINARTHLGGYTPLQLAVRREDGGEEVAAVLRAAGGVDTLADAVQYVPAVVGGRVFYSRQEVLSGEATAQSIHEQLFNTPVRHFSGGGHAVHGSFSVPDAEERLVFERIGSGANAVDMTLVALVDRHGATRLVLAFDLWTDFKGLCRDSATGTHSAVFERAFDGTCCPWNEIVYLHYDEDVGTLTEAFVDRDMRSFDPEGVCPWREKMAAESAYEELLATLRVGESAQLGDDNAAEGTSFHLPMRDIPRAVAEPALKTLGELPNDVAKLTWNDLGSSRWKTVTVSTGRKEDYTWGGVALLWDRDTETWRSFYDKRRIRVLGREGDKLIASAFAKDCGWARKMLWCYFELDLSTGAARRIARWSDRLEGLR